MAVPVGKLAGTFAVVDADAGDRAEGDVGKAVLVAVEIRTFQQGRLRINIPHLQIDAYGRVKVAHHLFTDRLKLEHNCVDFIFYSFYS